MKKSLIALAVAGAFAAPAFAATSNVDVYGKLHMSVSKFDDQPDGIDGINDVQITSNPSRIGVKGAEDLGNGLSAIWQVESGVNLDEQSGTWASRNSFVGLAGGFGTVLLGNHDTPLKLVGRSVDLFGDTLADSRNVMGVGSDIRAKNVITYMTPNLGGLGLAVAYSTDIGNSGNNGDANDMDVYNLNATYSNGPIYLGLGYGDGNGHEALGMGAHLRAAAGFTFGNAKLVAQYDKLDDDSDTVGTQPGDFDAWMVGGAYTIGNVVLKANYMEGEYDGDALLAGYDVEQWTVGADYNLSKRTALYALYTSGTNVCLGCGAGSSDRIAGGAVTGDADISALSLGVVHSF